MQRSIGVVICALSAVFLAASGAQADPFNSRPVVLDQNSHEASLQGIFDSWGLELNASTDQSSAALFHSTGTTTFTILAEFAGFRKHNKFGVYLGNVLDANGADRQPNTLVTGAVQAHGRATVFRGSHGVGATKTLDIPTQLEFGFDLFTPQRNRFFSEDSRNGGAAQAVIYRGSGQTFQFGVFGANELIVAFEDLRLPNSDYDYQDMVVLVSGVTTPSNTPGNPVPEPSSMALLGMSLLAVGGAHRRRNRILP